MKPIDELYEEYKQKRRAQKLEIERMFEEEHIKWYKEHDEVERYLKNVERERRHREILEHKDEEPDIFDDPNGFFNFDD